MSAPAEQLLVEYDPFWPDIAEDEITQLKIALGSNLAEAHHIGSTAIPKIAAKPVIDLLVIVKDLAQLDQSQSSIDAMGYVWKNDPEIHSKRFSYKNDPQTDQLAFQIHYFQENDEAIKRHLAFRDFLTLHQDIALKYQKLKLACQEDPACDNLAYTACKVEWIEKWEPEALKFFA